MSRKEGGEDGREGGGRDGDADGRGEWSGQDVGARSLAAAVESASPGSQQRTDVHAVRAADAEMDRAFAEGFWPGHWAVAH